VDGVVLARSVFHHSMNYRSVVALGMATLMEGATEKLDAIRAFTEKIVPGRWGGHVRRRSKSYVPRRSCNFP